MLDNPWLRLVNNWLHDFSSGLWGACVLVIALLQGRMDAGPPAEALAALGDAQHLMFRVLLAALAIIAATGVVRLFYWRAATPASEMASKRPALIGKHVAFLAIYGGGTLWSWSMLA